MKHLLLCSVVGISTAFGQITLTDQHFAGANESYIFSTLLDPTLDFATTGPNVTWDFSTLTPTGQRGLITNPISQASMLSQLYFGSFTTVPYRASYFYSTTDLPLTQLTSVLPVTIDDVSQFTKKETSKVTQVGLELVLSGQGVPVKSDTIETKYELPITYQDSYSSHGFTKLDMNPTLDLQWKQHRYRQSEVDGYGTVITPHGTFTAIRIHHQIFETDSVAIAGIWIPLSIPEAHEYEWRSMDDKEAVMRINTNVVLGQEAITAVEYRDEYNALGLENATLSLSVSPVPAQSVLTVTASSAIQQLIVIDASGKIVKREQVSNQLTAPLAIGELMAGNYQLVILSEAGVKSASFVKE
jgi:hypothetical protein